MINKSVSLLLVVITAVIFLNIGAYLGWNVRNNSANNEKTIILNSNSNPELTNVKLKAGSNSSDEVYVISGEVIKVEGNEIVFSTELLNNSQSSSLKIRTAIVIDNTKLTLVEDKSIEQLEADQKKYQEEKDVFNEKIKTIKSQIASCGQDVILCDDLNKQRKDLSKNHSKISSLNSKINSQEISIDDIKPGMSIKASTKRGNNIADLEKFEVNSVMVQSK